MRTLSQVVINYENISDDHIHYSLKKTLMDGYNLQVCLCVWEIHDKDTSVTMKIKSVFALGCI